MSCPQCQQPPGLPIAQRFKAKHSAGHRVTSPLPPTQLLLTGPTHTTHFSTLLPPVSPRYLDKLQSGLWASKAVSAAEPCLTPRPPPCTPARLHRPLPCIHPHSSQPSRRSTSLHLGLPFAASASTRATSSAAPRASQAGAVSRSPLGPTDCQAECRASLSPEVPPADGAQGRAPRLPVLPSHPAAETRNADDPHAASSRNG